MSRNQRERLKKLCELGDLTKTEEAELQRLEIREGLVPEGSVTPFKIKNDDVSSDLISNHGFLWAGKREGSFPVCRRYNGTSVLCSQQKDPCTLPQCNVQFEYNLLFPPPKMSKKKAKVILNKVLKKWQR